jgi:CBS domain containing-hemolysin-like protein
MFIFVGLIIITVLFILSAFWSGAETALTSLSKFRIKKLIALNKSLAVPLGQWLKSPYYLLTTILVGNTVNDMLLSFLSTLVIVKIFAFANREIVEFFSWIVLTFLLLILGEITPKFFGRSNPEKVTLFSLPVLSRIENLSRPFTQPIMRVMQSLFPKADPPTPIGRLTFLSLEEVRGIISEANYTGMLGKETSQMLEAALRLGDVQASRIMTPLDKVEAVNLDQPEERFLDLVVETGRSRVPVYHGDPAKVAGFVHTKDLLRAWQKNNGKFSSDLIRPPYFIAPDKKICDLLREFQSGKTHMAFVQDGFGNLLGIIALEDILEEILGEILDEYDLKKRGNK